MVSSGAVENTEEVRAAVCAFFDKHGLTIAGIDKLAAVSRRTVSNLLSGRAQYIQMETLVLIAAVFDVGVDDLLRGNVELSDTEEVRNRCKKASATRKENRRALGLL